MIRVTEGISLDDRTITERFVRATGPGGQNVKKEETAVELRLDIKSSSLPPDVKQRLISLAGRAITTKGMLVIVSRVHRSQAKNRAAARARLVALLRRAANPPAERQPTTPTLDVRDARLVSSRRRRAVKQARTRVRRDED